MGAGVWIPRYFPPRKALKHSAVYPLSATDVEATWATGKFSLQEPLVVDSDGWHVHHTFWDPQAIKAQFGRGYHVETGADGESASTGAVSCVGNEPTGVVSHIGTERPRRAEMWLEASECCHPDLEV